GGAGGRGGTPWAAAGGPGGTGGAAGAAAGPRPGHGAGAAGRAGAGGRADAPRRMTGAVAPSLPRRMPRPIHRLDPQPTMLAHTGGSSAASTVIATPRPKPRLTR